MKNWKSNVKDFGKEIKEVWKSNKNEFIFEWTIQIMCIGMGIYIGSAYMEDRKNKEFNSYREGITDVIESVVKATPKE